MPEITHLNINFTLNLFILRKNFPNAKFFWSVWSIWTAYGDLPKFSKSPFQYKYSKIWSRKTPYLDTFHAV